MPVKLFWTPKARADVKCIYIEMRKGQPRSAERYFATIRRKAELLIEHPRLGERHPVGSALARLFRGSELATLF
ncbi:type II toxin-antitoxin system RelE/ParE family toxin [Rhizobium sp. AQ_MP]|uniref:type II toxin-antitoxin system RelE/ParE family toxin n=1 Tax=Rhizobium sp. AQ_MP TaxID=2761536 RepID=UPI00163B11EE|nr:type II toxin-antitoxin system RelE/ParE family toxin [Rhizobium sp. AQ_MP]MBC2774718.1 type II toxin-antitoxin system RelE/ParE family toxin [Rhizobium sp. AQ_MP]